MNIAPQTISAEDGPFGVIYENDRGYTAKEWASIPPIPHKRDVTCGLIPAAGNKAHLTKMLDHIINTLLLESNIRLLDTPHQDIFLILTHGYKWLVDGKNHDCQKEALENHLNECQLLKWKRLDFNAIWATFPPKDEESQADVRQFFKEINKPLTNRWLYKVGSAQWGRYGFQDCMGTWHISNPFVK